MTDPIRYDTMGLEADDDSTQVGDIEKVIERNRVIEPSRFGRSPATASSYSDAYA